ncbi:TupA-like ATPgrasp [Marinospirillum celere]|uniref:TupA-like ATPgrasp n=1 Tax=Marinospirillum celere TaxID=1122252 RepID=A0A1I1E917_9GAMM|nr:ATP-grasp fold amidoligase family protein [Marinospirillum celere]SFB83625.1 TupA-like ATPgrasp [Marinospirillum celere]
MNKKIVAFYIRLYGVFNKKDRFLIENIITKANEKNISGWVSYRKPGCIALHIEGSHSEIELLVNELQFCSVFENFKRYDVNKTDPVHISGFKDLKNASSIFNANVSLSDLCDRASFLNDEFYEISNAIKKHKDHYESDSVVLSDILKLIPNRFFGNWLKNKQKIFKFNVEDVASSFTSEMWQSVPYTKTLTKIHGYSPERLLDNKINGLKFVNSIGVKTPELYEYGIPLNSIDFKKGRVVKPINAAGAKGVFSIVSEKLIISIDDGKKLSDYEEFIKEAKKYLKRSGRPDLWMSEELILNSDNEPPNDIKMLTFYGKVGLVQEERRMLGKVCYYDKNCNKISTGRYEDKNFQGGGVLPEHIRLAEEISLKIPSPFLRIDFLKSKNGLVFGEFTPNPGVFNSFNASIDTSLGREYSEARGRLMSDLLNGKKFDNFFDFLKSENI